MEPFATGCPYVPIRKRRDLVISYLQVMWHHQFDDEPVLMLSEIENGREVRKVEKFADGRTQYAGPTGSTGDTSISETLMPTAHEIALDPEFSVHPIDASDFEAEWHCATTCRSGP